MPIITNSPNPGGYEKVTLTGTYQTPDGTPHKGHVEIIPSERVIKDTTGNVILTGRVKVDLDAQGAFTVVLPATDDPTLNPTGFGYTIAAKLHSSHPPAVSFSLPAALGATTVEDLTPVDPSTFAPTTTYAEKSELDAVAATIPSTAADVNALPDTTTITDLGGIPKWKPNTTYTTGELATSPNGEPVTAKTTFTSGATYNAANWTGVVFRSRATYTTLPEVHAESGESTPVYGRTSTDGATVGAWNVVHDGIAGDLFHFTTGPNTGPSRTVTDAATTSGNATITSATANFTTGPIISGVGTDVGKAVSGPGIPPGTKIASVVNATTANLTANATATATGVTLTIGAGPNNNGCVLAIGVDHGGTGIITRNKSTGIALKVDHLNSSQAGSYGMYVEHQGANGPAIRYNFNAAAGATADLANYQIPSGSTIPTGAAWATYGANSIAGHAVAGKIRADTGNIDWTRSIQAVAPNASVTCLIRVADEVPNSPSETYMSGKTNGETGLSVYRWAGSSNLMYAFKWQAESDRFKLKAATGPAAKGSETMMTMIEVRTNPGIGGKGQLGFFGATPTNQNTVSGSRGGNAALGDLITKLATLGLIVDGTTA